MAKIDITTLEGYREDMTLEEKLSLYESFDVPDVTGTVSKEAFDRVSSELATLKRQSKGEKQTNEQRIKELEDDLKKMHRENAIAKNKTKLVALGFSEDAANESAEAFVDGDMEKYFPHLAKYRDQVKASVTDELLKGTPNPNPVATDNTMTEEDRVRKMLGI